MKSDGVAAWNDGSRNDVVSIQKEPETGSLIPSISTGGAAINDRTNKCCGEQTWNHEYAKVSNIKTIVC